MWVCVYVLERERKSDACVCLLDVLCVIHAMRVVRPTDMTLEDGWDFDSWVPTREGKFHMLFSKKLTKRELALLQRLGA